jgi:hypothetical protein
MPHVASKSAREDHYDELSQYCGGYFSVVDRLSMWRMSV